MPNILTDNKMVIDRMYAGELPGRDELKQLLAYHSKEDAEYLLSLQDRCVKMHMERMSIYVVWLNLLITAVITVIIVESGIAIVMHAGTG